MRRTHLDTYYNQFLSLPSVAFKSPKTLIAFVLYFTIPKPADVLGRIRWTTDNEKEAQPEDLLISMKARKWSILPFKAAVEFI